MYESDVFLDRRTCITTRGARICYFEATDRVLKEKRQGTEVRVRWITSESTRRERYPRIVNEAEIEEGTIVVSAERAFGG